MAFLSAPLLLSRFFSRPSRPVCTRPFIPSCTQSSSSSSRHPPPANDPPTPPQSLPYISNLKPTLTPHILFSEFLSTFLFIYVIQNALLSPTSTLTTSALLASLTASFMSISGAHLNPSITLAHSVTNRLSIPTSFAYIAVQLIASYTASLLTASLGTPLPIPQIPSHSPILRLLAQEAIPAFILVVVIFQTAVVAKGASRRTGASKSAALYVGLAFLACTGAFSNAAFNPARVFGPALVTGCFAYHWLFWTAPIFGAIAAALICEHCFLASAEGRRPNSWLVDCGRWSDLMTSKVKTVGIAGLIAYGIMNTAYYGIVFPVALLRIGFAGGVGSFAKAWVITWSFSQVTKPIRLALSLVIAPFINRFLVARADYKKKDV